MNNLLFLRRCFAFRHAARVELQKARMLPPGPERNQVRKLARALRDLARNEAWLEGQTLRTHRNEARFAIRTALPGHADRAHGPGWESGQIVVANWAAPAEQNFVMSTEGQCGGNDSRRL
jgi:hypothetical protein